MKKIISIILACALVLAVAAGCASQNAEKKDESATTGSPSEKTKITFVLD